MSPAQRPIPPRQHSSHLLASALLCSPHSACSPPVQAQDVSAADYAALAAGVGTPSAVANFQASYHALAGHAMAIVVSAGGTPTISGEAGCGDVAGQVLGGLAIDQAAASGSLQSLHGMHEEPARSAPQRTLAPLCPLQPPTMAPAGRFTLATKPCSVPVRPAAAPAALAGWCTMPRCGLAACGGRLGSPSEWRAQRAMAPALPDTWRRM